MDELAEPIIDEPAEQEQEQEQSMIMSLLSQIEARHAMKNIAAELDRSVIDRIAAKVVDDYNTDMDSRAVWETSMSEIMNIAKLLIQKKTYAGEQVANVKYPIITSAVIQFAARAYPEIIKGADVVKAKVVGKDQDGVKAERGKRVSEHMSYQLLNDMPEWEEGVDQLLFTLPATGCAFKKTYRNGVDGKNVSEMIFPEDLVVHYHAVSLEKASRVTHKVELTQNEIVERIRTGIFLDFEVEELGQGVNEKNDISDEDTPHLFLEQHRWYDLDEDGYQEPYIATVHYSTQKLVRLSARYELSGVQENENQEILRIEPTHYFTRFMFMPSPDGSFYGMGLGSLLHSINSSANTILNQLLDAGTLSNRQSGFLGRGVQLGRGASLRFRAGEWKPVQATGDDLRKNIVPLPTHEPSAVLFQLLGLMIETGKELSGATEVLSGQSPGSNVPAETTLALIEQGLQVYSAIHKRVHRSLYREFKKIRKLNQMYLTNEEYNAVTDIPADVFSDYNSTDHDIIPVSDPNSTTNMQRIMKAKALLVLRGQGLNDKEINKRYLKALQIEDIEALIPEEEQQDPLVELDLLTKREEIGRIVAAQGKIAAETQLITEKINSEKTDQQVKAMGTQFDDRKLKLEEAQTISDIKSTENQNKREAAKLINDIKSAGKAVGKAGGDDSNFEGKTSVTNTQGSYREKGMVSNNKDI